MPYDEILAEMPKVTDNQQESVYLPLADYENAGLVKPSKDYFKVLPDGTLIPINTGIGQISVQELKTVTINENGRWSISPDDGFDAIGKVLLEITVPAGIDTSDATINPEDILAGKFGYGRGKRIEGTMINNSNQVINLDASNTSKTLNGFYKNGTVRITIQNQVEITPTKERQIVEAENGKVLGTVKINPIPDEFIVPDETLYITANGNYDTKKYANAVVNVPSDLPDGYYKPEGTVTFTKNTTEPVSIAEKAFAIVDVQLPKYDGSVTILNDEVEISGKYQFDDTKFVYSGIERSAEINFQLLDSYNEGDIFDTMKWSAGNLIYIRDGVQYIVFDYAAYMQGEVGWKYELGLTGAIKEVDFGSAPQKVSKEFYDWFIGVTEEVAEQDELAGTWLLNASLTKVSTRIQSGVDGTFKSLSNGNIVQRNILSFNILPKDNPTLQIIAEETGTNSYYNDSGNIYGIDNNNKSWTIDLDTPTGYDLRLVNITSTLAQMQPYNGDKLLTWLKANATKQ
jgi:hypothetical protein